jgi:hypothetical protein
VRGFVERVVVFFGRELVERPVARFAAGFGFDLVLATGGGGVAGAVARAGMGAAAASAGVTAARRRNSR